MEKYRPRTLARRADEQGTAEKSEHIVLRRPVDDDDGGGNTTDAGSGSTVPRRGAAIDQAVLWADADFVVRPATESDCEDLIQIFSEGLRRDGFEGDPWFESIVIEYVNHLRNDDKERALKEAYAIGNDLQRRDELADKGRTVRGALIGSAMMYYSYGRLTGRGAVLEDIYVVGEFRGKGLAKILFRKCCELALSRACRTFRARVPANDLLLKSFLEERHGRNITQRDKVEEYSFNRDAMEAIASQEIP